MRVFLAATNQGMSREMRDYSFQKYKPRYVLETFFNGESSCLKAMQSVGKDKFPAGQRRLQLYERPKGNACSDGRICGPWYIAFIVKYQVKHFIRDRCGQYLRTCQGRRVAAEDGASCRSAVYPRLAQRTRCGLLEKDVSGISLCCHRWTGVPC